ncbi:MAG: arginine deiminase-related protein, partial [Chitinophagaceae bacterium]
MQNTSHILMIRPYNFTYNAQTAVNNSFQNAPQGNIDANAAATAEFDAFAALLKANGIQVHVVQDTAEPATPDSIFPNNWISFHQSGRVCLYPMFAEN